MTGRLDRVVRTMDNAIHRKNYYPVDKYYWINYVIRWRVLYPMDSAIQLLNNWGLIITWKIAELVCLHTFMCHSSSDFNENID